MNLLKFYCLLLLVSSCGSKIQVDNVKFNPKITSLEIQYNESTDLNVNDNLNIPLDMNTSSAEVVIVTPPTNGVLTKNANNNWTYTPNANFFGNDTFVLQGTIGDLSKSITITLNVINNNNPPVTSNDAFTMNKNNTYNVDLSNFTTDVETDDLTYTITSNPTNGVVSSFDSDTGTFTYTPNANFNGSDTISFKANDSLGESNTSTLNITVTNNNNIPNSSNSSVTTDEDVASSGSLSANDLDGDSLTYAMTKSPDNGLFNLNISTGSYTYTPDANFNGTDTIKFRANDGTDNSSEYTITFTVNAVNDLPVPADNTYTFNEDTAQNITLAGAGTDAESDTLTFEIVSSVSNGAISSFDTSNGTLTYTPDANFNGSDSFIYRISDGTGYTATKTITLNVTSVNDSPIYNDVSTSTDEDTVLSSTYGATDVDGDTLTYSIQSNPSNGILSSLNTSTGYVTYTPNANFNGSDTFSLSVNDGTDTTTMTVTVTVNAVDDVFALSDQSIDLFVDGTNDTIMILSTPDVDGDVVYSITKNPDHGVVTSFNSSTGSYTYTPTTSYVGTDTIEVTGNDGTTTDVATVTYTVSPEPSPKIYIMSGNITSEDMDLYSIDKNFNVTFIKNFPSDFDMRTSYFSFRENYVYYYSDSGNGKMYRYDIAGSSTQVINNTNPTYNGFNLPLSDDIVISGDRKYDFGDLSDTTINIAGAGANSEKVNEFIRSAFGTDTFIYRNVWWVSQVDISLVDVDTLSYDSLIYDHNGTEFNTQNINDDKNNTYDDIAVPFGNYVYFNQTNPSYELKQCSSGGCLTMVGEVGKYIPSNYEDKMFFKVCNSGASLTGEIYSADLLGNFVLEHSMSTMCELGEDNVFFVTKDYYGRITKNSGDNCPKVSVYNKSDDTLNKNFVLSSLDCSTSSINNNIVLIKDSNAFVWAQKESNKTYKVDVENETATDLGIAYKSKLSVIVLQ